MRETTPSQADSHQADFHTRRAGVLLHPSSLPSSRLDADVERWLDWLQATGMQVWQMLPLGEPQFGDSPYQCASAFALDPAWLDESSEADAADSAFQAFCEQQQHWLDDYALYKLIKQQQDEKPWYDWPDALKWRDKATLEALQNEHGEALLQTRWRQFRLFTRWREIRQAARSRGILLFGDMPIFVAHDSADVWACPQHYLLDDKGRMRYVTGVPPDYFSATGQRWGNPHYDWAAMEQDDFRWWRQRLRLHFELFDFVRIDHFRGLESVWMIDGEAETAAEGHFAKTPGRALLQSVKKHLGALPLVAEDLGIITDEVIALRKDFALPGMAVLQFSFDGFADNPHKPENIQRDCVVYTGTHDNDTSKGWFCSLDADTQAFVLQRLNLRLAADSGACAGAGDGDGDGAPAGTVADTVADAVVEAMIEQALRSRASLCMLPLQDCLHLGSEARMNTPGTVEGNWQWRFDWAQLTPERAQHCRRQVALSERGVCDDHG